MDEVQNPTAGTPIYQEAQGGKSAKWLWLLVILIIIGAMVFAYVRGIGPFAQFAPGTKISSPGPTSNAGEASPVASAATEIDKASAKIRVLNGTGKAGVAASAKDYIQGKGYVVASIGNAANNNFVQTVIRFKETFKNFEQAVTGDLSDKYSIKVSTDDLEATDSADIEITIGTQ